MKPKYFQPQELFPPETIKKYGLDCWYLLDVNLTITIDAIHDLFPGCVMIANTWGMSQQGINRYGTYTYRGYRPQGCGVGVVTGAHYKGKALDFDIWQGAKRLSPEYVRKVILENRDKLPYIKGIEIAEWVHIDIMDRKNPAGKICLFDTKNNARWV